MEDNIIDNIDEDVLNPPPYNPDYQPNLDNTEDQYLHLENINDQIEEIPRIQTEPEVHTIPAMFVLNNRRRNRILHRPQLHLNPQNEIEHNTQTIKQEQTGTKPKIKKENKPSSDPPEYESESSDYSEKRKNKKHTNKKYRHYDPLNPHGFEDRRHHKHHEHRHKQKDKQSDSDKEDRRKDDKNFSMPKRMNKRRDSSSPTSSSSSSSSDTESDWDRRTSSNNRDNRNREEMIEMNLLENKLTSEQMDKLRLLLQDSPSHTDLNIKKIMKLIPNNLVWGTAEHERIFRQIKYLGKIPNLYGEQTNPYTFFNTFKYLEQYIKPFTHSSYNNIIIHYFNPESRNKLDMLEIDPNVLSAQDFVKAILTTIGAEILGPQDYERRFHTYRITTEDEDRPNKAVINLAAMLQKTGNSHENQMAKLREKVCFYLVPQYLQSAFLATTNVPNCTKETILNWFSNNRSYYHAAVDRKRRMEKQKNGNVNQLGKNRLNSLTAKKETPKDNGKNKGQQNDKNAKDVSTKPKPVCEHCKKGHYSKHCLKHPDPAIRKANGEWWDKKKKEKELANRIVCLLCNSDTHGSADCHYYPNVTPAQEQCPRCLHYGITRRHHPLAACTLPLPAEKNG